jgi:hypothetical protein
MPDTGAPWNIPYVETTDLVSDWPADSLLVANAVAAGLSAAGNAGIGSNVVSVTKLDTFTTSSTSMVDITDLTVTITPSSNTAKILVLMNVNLSNTSANQSSNVRLVRTSTAIAIGNAAGSRTRSTFSASLSNQYDIAGVGAHFIDSPATASAVTYHLEISANGGTATVNRMGGDADAASNPRTVSSLTVIEVAA